jgi:serine/threonine-protein kinase
VSLTLVEGLVIEHLRRHGSDPERSLAALGLGRSTRECLAQIGNPELGASLARVGPGSTEPDDDADRTASYAVGSATADGPRFRVLRPHARGGLGAVFVARDAELNREVALKQIRDEHADDPISRQRFLVEAEITGGLEHPGIVPVYGLGSYSNGRPYYVMRFIRGDSLKEAIERFHADTRLKPVSGRRALELRQLLRRFTDVCNAIDYAHSRGVLHRDIKPANVIVGQYGETLVVDWGLAKATGRADPGAARDERTLRPASSSLAETLPGSALGTPAYMSPEQAAGELEKLGPRTDVYSLGATLYCLLTGRPPFPGDEAGLILRQVQRGEFPSPRTLDPSIDRALEAVRLKAMARLPEDRSASPRMLADDLERWTADEPVLAWREPIARRALRWARRNRALVAGAAAALLAGVVGLAAVLAVQTRAQADLTRALANETLANRALGAANAELARSRAAVQARFDLAIRAIRTFHTGVSTDFLLKEDRFQALRDRLLKAASDFYSELGASLQGQSDRASRRALGQANYEVAELTGEAGRKGDALAAHRRVLADREALVREPGAGAADRAAVGRSLVAIGRLLEETGRPAEALEALARVRTQVEGPSASDTGSGAARAVLATSLYWSGVALLRSGRLDDALRAYRGSWGLRRELTAADPEDLDTRRELSWCANDIGLILRRTGRTDQALAAYEESRRIQEALVAAHPDVPEYRRDVSVAWMNIGNAQSVLGRTRQALTAFQRAQAILQALARTHPAVSRFQGDLAGSHLAIGWLLSRTGRPAEALAAYRAALAIQRRLAEANPTVTDYQSEVAWSRHNIGVLLGNSGRMQEALAECRAALAIQRELAEANPAVARFQSHLALSHFNIGTLMLAAGKPSEALAEYRTALAIRQRLVAASPTVIDFQSELAQSHDGVGRLLSRTGRPAEALAEYRAALAIQRRLAEANPDIADYQGALARSHKGTGWLLAREGRPAEALAEYRAALAIQERLADAHPAIAEYQEELVSSLSRVGRLHQELGRAAEAADAFRKAIASLEKLPRSPGNTYDQACYRSLLCGLGGRPGSGVSAAEGQAEAGRAMDLLRRAVAAGYRDLTNMRIDPDLDPLRSRPDFQVLLMDLAMPDDPFAGRD